MKAKLRGGMLGPGSKEGQLQPGVCEDCLSRITLALWSSVHSGSEL